MRLDTDSTNLLLGLYVAIICIIISTILSSVQLKTFA